MFHRFDGASVTRPSEDQPRARLPLPPGPRGAPVLGILPEWWRSPLDLVERYTREYGDIVSLPIGPLHMVVVSSPALIEKVLVTDNRRYVKHYHIRLLARLMHSNGLLFSEGDFWRRQRRLAQPAFHRQRIAAYGEVMVERGLQMTAAWVDCSARDVHADMLDVTAQIVAKTLLDSDVSEAGATVRASLQAIMESFEDGGNAPVTLPEWLPLPMNRRAAWARERLGTLIDGIIRDRQASGEDRGDLLSMLIAARDEDGEPMSFRQLHDEVMVLFLAGHETTSNALSWTWWLLSQHPEVEERLQAELRGVLGGRPPAVSDLPQLRYTEMVLTEAMRLYPPAWAIGREPIEDVELGGYRIPKGWVVAFPQWVVHRDPRYYEDPAAFRPERWGGDAAARLPKYAYFPFGAGPRLCIGNQFAMMEGTLLLAAIAQHWRLELAPGAQVTPWPSVTLRPKEGMRMIVHRRQP